MTATSTTRAVLAAAAIATALAGGLGAAPAAAQMFNEPFTFTSRSPQGMAIYMRQRDDANRSTTATAVAGSSESPTLVCAGTGENTATSAGNIMCVLAGSGANVIVGSDQDSTGDQTSDATTTQTSAEEIQNILDGNTSAE